MRNDKSCLLISLVQTLSFGVAFLEQESTKQNFVITLRTNLSFNRWLQFNADHGTNNTTRLLSRMACSFALGYDSDYERLGLHIIKLCWLEGFVYPTPWTYGTLFFGIALLAKLCTEGGVVLCEDCISATTTALASFTKRGLRDMARPVGKKRCHTNISNYLLDFFICVYPILERTICIHPEAQKWYTF